MLLAKYATELKAAGLSRITVSLDTLDPEVFATMSGGFGGVAEVLDGIEHARRAGLAPIKINTVVQRGVNDHTLLDLLEHFRGTGVIVRFIEYMDVGTRNHWQPASWSCRRASCAARIHARWPLRRSSANYRGEVAERYAFDDGAGEIGFISSVIAAVLRRLLARAPLLRRLVLHLPVRDAGHGPARPAARRRQRRRAARADPRRLERRAATATASCAPRCATPRDLHKVEMNYIGG